MHRRFFWMDNERDFVEDGVHWSGTRQEREQWKQYKQQKAVAFVQRSYSVEWYSHGRCQMRVYLPDANTREISALVKLFMEPSEHGINGGRISKLIIERRRRSVVERLFVYDRGTDTD